MEFKEGRTHVAPIHLVLLSLLCKCCQSRFLRFPDPSLELHVPFAFNALQIFESIENQGGPVSLQDYCAMKEGKFVRRQKVNAIPHSGGDPQPGVIVKANEKDQFNDKAHTVDVLFKNGNHDMNIDVKNVSPRDTPKDFKERDDSACIVEGAMTKVQADVDKAYDDIKNWLKNRHKQGKAAAEEAATQAKAKAEQAAEKLLAATKREEEAAEEKLVETQVEEAEAEKELKEATNTQEATKARENLEDVKAKEKEQKDQLDEIEEEGKHAENELKDAQNKDIANTGNVEGMAAKLAKTIKDLQKQKDELGKKNKLDPELRLAIDETLDEAKQAEKSLKKVGEAEERGGDHLVATVEEAEKELKDAKKDMQQAEAGIYPSGDRWWRFRYEFSYVEAMFAVLMSLMGLIGESLLKLGRTLLKSQSEQVRWQDEREVPTMYLSWFRHLGSEGLVLLWMNLAVWVLWMAIPWVYESWITMARDPYMHLPTKKDQYKIQAWETAVHLSLSMIMYFLAIYMVVHHASNRLRRWGAWASQMEHHRTTSTGYESSPFIYSIHVVGSSSQMEALRSVFLSEIAMQSDLTEFAKTHKVAMNEDFPFFLYLSQCMHQAFEEVFIVKVWTWVFIVLIFGVFALCHRYLHLGTAELLCVFGVFMIITFAAMIYGVLRATEHIKKERQLVTDSSRVNMEDLAKEKKFEHQMCAVLQLIIFFLCFGTVRLIASYWMWTLYYWYAVFITLGLVVFVILWLCVFAPLISAFMAVVCVPPYIHTHSFKKTVLIMRPPEMTPLPPDEIQESVEKIDGLVKKLDK